MAAKTARKGRLAQEMQKWQVAILTAVKQAAEHVKRKEKSATFCQRDKLLHYFCVGFHENVNRHIIIREIIFEIEIFN